MNPTTALILATDDTRIADTVRRLVRHMKVIRTAGPVAAEALPPGEIRCFIDWVLRDVSGFELCRILRGDPSTARAHMTLVLEDGDAETRSRALKCGADDYVLGPLSPTLVLDRLDRYSEGSRMGLPAQRLRIGSLELDPSAHRLWHQGAVVPLQPRQFALMSFLMQHPDRVHARSELLRTLGRNGGREDERTVDAWVARLRRDLRHSGAPDPIRTVRDYGYVLDSL